MKSMWVWANVSVSLVDSRDLTIWFYFTQSSETGLDSDFFHIVRKSGRFMVIYLLPQTRDHTSALLLHTTVLTLNFVVSH